MRLAWATDPHLNFVDAAAAARAFRPALDQGAEGLLLTGDIAEAPSLERWLGWLLEELGLPIWFVLGNHDYYRGSLAGVRERMQARTASADPLWWMEAAGVVALSERTALVGADGWGDGRLGGPWTPEAVFLNDFLLIEELRAAAFDDVGEARGLNPARLLSALNALGDASARVLDAQLDQALPAFPEVLVLTHVPPFAGASWHEGRLSDPEWMPHFACQATGEVLLRHAARWPERRIRVLCGHTHSGGVYRPRENLEVVTGGARYRSPELQEVVVVR